MNRKMKAKANNAAARKAKACPLRGKLVPGTPEQTHCDRCGDELGPPVFAIVFGDDAAPLDKNQIN